MTVDVDVLWTYADVSEWTKIKVGTLRKYVLTGRMPYLKLNGMVRFRPGDIREWLEDNAHRPVKPRVTKATDMFEGGQ